MIEKIILRIKNLKWIFIFFIIILILSIIFYNNIFLLMNNLSDKIEEKTNINLGKTFYDFESAINIFRPTKDLWSGDLPIFQFKFSKNDLEHFNNLSEKSVAQGYLDAETNTWRSVQLKYNGKIYDAEVNLHGDTPIHWETTLKSYHIKLSGNETINGLEKFWLILFEDRVFDGRIIRILSEEFGLFNIRDDFVVVKINGVPQGLYYLIERLDNTFLENNQCSSCEIIKLRDTKFKDHPLDDYKPYGLDYIKGHTTPFDYEISHIDLEKSDLDLKKVINSINGFFEAIKEKDSERLIEYFDIDQVTTFEAQRMLSGFQQVAGDDLKMVYSATNSKFYPIPSEGGFEYLVVEKGGLERKLNIYNPGSYGEVKIFSLLNRNDEVRQLKYKKAYQYIIEKGDSFLNKIDELVKEYAPYAYSNKGSIVGTKEIERRIEVYKPLFEHNMKIIKEVLEYAKCYINVIEKENKISLEIIPDSVSQIKFDSFFVNLNEEYSGDIVLDYADENNNQITKKINIQEKTNSIDMTDMIKDFYFSTGLDEDLGTKKRIYTIMITFTDIEDISIDDIDVKMINDVTEKPLKQDEIYLQIANANDYYDPLTFSSAEEFMEKYKEFIWDKQESTLTILKGDYYIKRDIIIPKNLTINIESGVQIFIDKDKSIISYSPINIMGTETQPVIIRATDEKNPFGTFGILGEERQKSTINYLRLSGGNEKFINGIYFSGSLSIYHTDVDISNTIISDGHSDDGINIKYSKVLINDCSFINNFADQLDLDFVTGVVKNSQFRDNPQGDNNGDGLDASGSEILIKNNLFDDFKDKGISIGERTKVVLYQNEITKNNLGAAVKDSSYAFFIENTFGDNKIALSQYKKKPIYESGGFSYLYNNEFKNNIKQFEIDETSQKNDLELDNNIKGQIIKDILDEDLNNLFQIINNFIK